jgi:hypothetical protein
LGPTGQVETAVSKAIFDNEKRLREQGAAMHATLRQVRQAEKGARERKETRVVMVK